MVKIYQRWQTEVVAKALKSWRVIEIAGARQCGKTTLAKALGIIDGVYRTLDDVTLFNAAIDDPHGFVKHENRIMIIDEIQKAPNLLPAIKKDVDENQIPGRFLITGSANIQSLPSVNESLAGRIKKIRLRPLVQGEIYEKLPDFLDLVFSEKLLKQSNVNNKDDKDSYIKIALRGGYPEPFKMNNLQEAQEWHLAYMDSLISRDLKDLINIKRHSAMKELLAVIAAWSSKAMDMSAIGSSLSMTRQTITTYINAIEALYLLERLPVWPKTDYDRVTKQDKIFMTDTGLMSAILNWNFDKVRLDGDKNGKLIETFVFNQLLAHIEALALQNKKYSIYHYRDREKREIDFIIENDNNEILGIEVKAGSLVNTSYFKHLKWFRTNIAKDKKFIGIVLYTGDQMVSFGDKMWAVPINILW